MAGADSEADALAGAVEDHVEALHDDSAHDGAGGGLRDGELVAVVLRGGHILHRPQVLLHQGKLSAPAQGCRGRAGGRAHPAQPGLALTWGRMVMRKDWLVASPIR